MGIRISTLLDANRVLRLGPVPSKAELLTFLAGTLAQLDGLPRVDDIVARLLRREAQTSTGIGLGVAIPHCALPDLDRPHLLFAASRAGVAFDALDGEPVHIIFLVLAPEARPSVYLQLLARISRLVHDATFRQRLIDAESPAELLRILLEEDACHA